LPYPLFQWAKKRAKPTVCPKCGRWFSSHRLYRMHRCEDGLKSVVKELAARLEEKEKKSRTEEQKLETRLKELAA